MYVAEIRHTPEGCYEWKVTTSDPDRHGFQERRYGTTAFHLKTIKGEARTPQQAMKAAARKVAESTFRDVLQDLRTDYKDCPPDARAEA